MEERTLRVLEYNRIKEMLKEQAICVEARERCGALLPVDNIYEARALLSVASEAEPCQKYFPCSCARGCRGRAFHG